MRAIRPDDKNEESKRERVVRRKFNPHSPPTTVEIHGIRVHFPFRPYDCQQTYMTKVMEALLRSENALLESPTGTGKTLCLLCACLAWQREQSRLISQQKQPASAAGTQTDMSTCSAKDAGGANLKHSRVPTIIYASRTHSQLSQVVQELRNTRYRPLHAVLGSREQMCVNPKVKKQNSTASDINHDCNKLGKDRKCRYRNGLDSFVAPREEGSEGGQQQAVMDLEDLVELGKQHKICPFYYTRSQVETAELILVPYNYLFDKDARETTLSTIPWDNAVVIFDEAHNLESLASESASFDLTSTDIAGCVNELQVAINYLESLTDLNYGITVMNLLEVKDAFLKLESFILDLNPNRTAYSGEFMIEILSKGAKLHYGNHEVFVDIIKKVNDMLLDLRGASARSGAPRLEHFVQCVKRVYGHSMESRCYAKAAYYRVHVSPKQATMASNSRTPQQNRTVSFWCFAPSLAMEELAGLKIRSILVTSGTLSPLPSYSLELGIPFPLTLENPHIISTEQIHVRVVGKGVSGKILSSSFERRKDSEYYTELGNTLVSLAKVTPEGMLVFFPSYNVMETCIERWGGPTSGRSARQGTDGANSTFFHARRRQTATPTYTFPQTTTFFRDNSKPSTPWQRLRSTKAVVLEPKSSVDLPDAITEFKRFLALPNSSGCILMGVCRGKISEGIDFAHEQSRAVVITGLPFPPSHDPRVKMKREFLDQARAASSMQSRDEGGFGVSTSLKAGSSNHLSGLEWYTQQAHRAVNQAIGRVIRNASDYGAVLLLDNRFEQPANQNGLSMWLRPHIQKDEGFGRTVSVLSKFFKAAEAFAKEKKRTAVSFAPEPLVLEYEADAKERVDEKLTKIAVVRASANSDADGASENVDTENESTSYVDPDRVIAKVDFKDLQKRPMSPSWQPSGVSAKRTKASDDDGELKSDPHSFQAGSTKPVAAQFFARARSTLSQEDLAHLKTVIVAAREQKELKNEKGFIKASTDAVTLLVRCDGLEQLGNQRSESNLLLLFFQLLPPAYRHNVELSAMKRTFDRSTLYRQTVSDLEPGFFGMFRTQVVSLLHLLWCRNSDSPLSTSDYLTKAEAVVRVILKVEKSSSKTVQSAFLKLIPSTYHSCTRHLAAEMLATHKIEKMKAEDKAKLNRVSAPLKRESSSDTSCKAPPASESGDNDRQATTRAGVPSRFDSSARNKKNSAPPLTAKPSPLSMLIEKVESEVYIQQSTAEIAKQVPSASDSSMSCPVCCVAATEPFMADCGHIACLECWKSWLARSESCPTCRTVTSIESIARIVVSSRPDESTSSETLRQFCRPVKTETRGAKAPQVAEDDSESELELC